VGAIGAKEETEVTERSAVIVATIDSYMRDVIDPGDRASKLAKEICVRSFRNNRAVLVVPHDRGNFRGPVSWLWQPAIMAEMAKCKVRRGKVVEWTMAQSLENDGDGGKPQFFSLIGTMEVLYDLGWEVIAMTADDQSRSGRFPCIMDNQADVKQVNERNFHLVRALFVGYGRALRATRLVNLTGEFAVMKHSITAFCNEEKATQLILTIDGSCIGLTSNELLLRPESMKPGMVIVGLWEPGYRCNGGTFFTKVLLGKFGPDIKKIRKNPKAMDFVRRLCTPSRVYTPLLTELCGWNTDGTVGWRQANIVGIVNVTGGGVWGKLGDILPAGVGADLNKMPRPAKVLLDGQRYSIGMDDAELSDWQAYSTLHGGCGNLVICATYKDARIVIEAARQRGIPAKVVGSTMASRKSEIVITSRFLQKRGKRLSSLHPE